MNPFRTYTVYVDESYHGQVITASMMTTHIKVEESGKPIGQVLAEMVAACNTKIEAIKSKKPNLP